MSHAHDVALMTSVTTSEAEPTTAGLTVTRIQIAGDPAERAIIDAAVASYPRRMIDFATLDGQKVTLLVAGQNMLGAPILLARPCTIRSGGTAYLPKGSRTRGYRLQPERVLDWTAGYDGADVLRQRLDDVRQRFPQVRPLTKERLQKLPNRGSTCTLAVFGRHQLPGMPPCLDAMWLLHSYINDGDIVEGVLYTRPDAGISEHGSIYGSDLLRVGGEIVDAPTVPLAEALEWTNRDHDEVLAAMCVGAAR
jgi:hypothetical protein